jgi:hypothetical protein
MKNPISSQHIWGVVVGGVAVAVIGFAWGGWVTGGTASKMQAEAATSAKVAALAPICATRFQEQDGASTKLAALKSESSWSRSTVIEKSGFATMPGSKAADSDVARACADLLANLPATKG